MIDRVFICSPYRGDVQRNVAIAKLLCRKAIACGLVPFASHLLYPQFLDDKTPKDRATGMFCAKAFLVVCQQVWAYKTDAPTSGMKDEIVCANLAGIPIDHIELSEEEIIASLD